MVYNSLVISTLDFCRIPRANFVILSDNDMGDAEYRWLPSNPLVESLTVYWNNAGKDFGEEIIDPVKKVFHRIQRNVNKKQNNGLSV